jgi:hypothetical protein
MVDHLIELGLGIIEAMVFFDPHLRHLNILVGLEAGVFQDLLGAGHRAAIDPTIIFAALVDSTIPLTWPPMPARHYILPILSWVNFSPARLAICPTLELPEQEKTFLFHFSSSSLDPFLDFFHFGDLSCDLDDSIHNQGRSDHDSIAADLFDILHFYHFRFHTRFFNRFLSSLLELIAFGSPHSQYFDLFHLSLPFVVLLLPNISLCPP